MPNEFVSSSNFTLPDEILRKLRRTAFVTGRAPAQGETRGAIEAALSVGAERESRFAQIAEERRQREEELAQQESQFQRSQQFAREQQARAESEAESQRRSEFRGGIAQAATTLAGFGILKKFGIF